MERENRNSAESDGCAFPLVSPQLNAKGMTLRDWFAGQALAGILSGGFGDTIPHDDVNAGREAAAFAYQYADAMLAERRDHATLVAS